MLDFHRTINAIKGNVSFISRRTGDKPKWPPARAQVRKWGNPSEPKMIKRLMAKVCRLIRPNMIK
jgi:hypothetical protein